VRGDDDVGAFGGMRRIAEERVADAIEHREDGREIDVHLVGKAVGDRHRQLLAGDVGMIAARQLPMSAFDLIGAGIARNAENVVVVAHGAEIEVTSFQPPAASEIDIDSGKLEAGSGKRVAEIKECPLCGETLRFRTREMSEHIPGTGQTSTRNVREWVCP
jgi:YgiT-type zinc finger domain-containing protein